MRFAHKVKVSLNLNTEIVWERPAVNKIERQMRKILEQSLQAQTISEMYDLEKSLQESFDKSVEQYVPRIEAVYQKILAGESPEKAYESEAPGDAP
jgi:hypothetical protein